MNPQFDILIDAFATGLTLSETVIPLSSDLEEYHKIRILGYQKTFAYGYAYSAIKQIAKNYSDENERKDIMKKLIIYLRKLYNNELYDIKVKYGN